MKYVDSRTGIEVMDRDECLSLLAQDEIGRLAVIAGDAPVIVPVNYAMDGEAIVFRTAAGTKHDAGARHSASFEIDRFDPATRSGWSVVATGRLEEATPYDRAVLERVVDLPVDPWARGDKPYWMRLVPQRITGRRVTQS